MFSRLSAMTLLGVSTTVPLLADPPPPSGRCMHSMHTRWLDGQIGTERAGNPMFRDDDAADTDVLHYDLHLTIDPLTEWIGGSNQIAVQSLVDGLSTFRLGLHDALTISEVRVDDVVANWNRVDAVTFEITLPAALNAGQTFEVFVAYAGNPVPQGSWDSITFRTRSGAREVWSMSVPYWSWSWWPCKDVNWDKATAEMSFVVPDDMVVASNGHFVGAQDVGAGLREYAWATDYQIAPYLLCFAATNFTTFDSVWEYDGGSMPLNFFIYPEHDQPSNRNAWLASADMLTVFSQIYGQYPFINDKYGICEFGWGGGMEHQTMTFQGGFWESVTAHELAHSWWGNSVTCATWHDVWLNEGFATYSEALYYEHRPGGTADDLHDYMANDIMPLPTTETVYVYDISNMDRIFDRNTSYSKGAWVLHMLRHVVGDANFFDTLAAYRAAFEGSAASTEDFRAVAEAVSGMDLDWFFAEWIYASGEPWYYYAWRECSADGVPYLELYISQHPFKPVFTMPIDFRISSDFLIHTHPVWNDERVEHLLIPLGSPNVTSVELDPTPWILRTVSTTSFAEGPPKVVQLRPTPERGVAASNAITLVVGFHKDVVISAADIQLAGVNSGTVPCTLAYDSGRQVATITPSVPLGVDAYTLNISESVTDVASGTALDGELTAPFKYEPLPSGDGRPGGTLVVTFHVRATGDMNCDGVVDRDDVDPFVAALIKGDAGYDAAVPGCDRDLADINADGSVDFGDINPFVMLLGVRDRGV